ncbi:MAG TPA: hypothetical protein VHY48_04150 [Acidobacteriaceae bacterium]|jgi:hypothetical protein|nr:hypothetical protein [Acidobacteriaceae bacterium]
MVRCRTAFGVSLFLFLFVSIAARAQFGVYGTVTGERVTGFICQDPQGHCAASNGTVKPYGGTFGGYYDFRSLGPFRVGVDLRGSVLNSNKSATLYASSTDLVRHYAALGGLRAEARTPFHWLHPYVEAAAGLGRSNATSVVATQYQNYTQVQGFVGADITLLPMLDLRAIELGAGEMFGPSSHSIQSIGIGVVFHTGR